MLLLHFVLGGGMVPVSVFLPNATLDTLGGLDGLGGLDLLVVVVTVGAVM